MSDIRTPRRNSSLWLWVESLALTLFIFAACSGGDGTEGQQPSEQERQTFSAPIMRVTSSAFVEGADIPVKYTCQDQDVSPPLEWSGVPDGTQSIALIMDDPDAPGRTFVHWVLYDIPADVSDLPEGVEASETTSFDATNGVSGFRRLGYGGPCPPAGGPHRYFFKLYALDTMIGLEPGATKADVELAMEGHTLANGQLMGRYQRR